MTKKITLIPGDGIGPEVMDATLHILDALKCDLTYDMAIAGETALKKVGELIPQKTLDLIRQNKIALKGPITTPVGTGFKSINVTLRQEFNLYANVRPIRSFPVARVAHANVNLIIVRENTEGLYAGKGQIVAEDDSYAEAVSVVTRKGSEHVIRYAYELARRENRKKVALVHKANILKSTSGLFLRVGREIAAQYPDIQTQEVIIDNCCMQLVMNPHQFDVIVTTNLFGDILSDLCAGLVGGLGLAPGANMGDEIAIFEAVHGSAPDIAGKNKANPCSLLLSAAMMLDHLGDKGRADRIRYAIHRTLGDQDRLTPDLGGESGTTEFTQAIIERL